MTSKLEKEVIRQAFIQVCKDSEFNLHWGDAAVFTADILRIPPMEVPFAFSKIEDLNIIALGLHPMVPNPKIKLSEK